MTFRFGLAAALAAGLMVAPVTGWAQQKIKIDRKSVV